METLIGLTGRAGSGKDSVWKILSEELDQPVKRVAFADPLRQSAMAALGMFERQAAMFKMAGEVVVYLEGDEAGSLTGREFLQLYGTEAHRDIFGDDFWVQQAMKQVDGITVITDVRYDNEAEAIIERGGVVWEVRRPGDLIPESLHRSEQPVSRRYIDRVVHNDGRLEDLRYEVMLAWEGCFPSDERLLTVAREKVAEQLSMDEELKHNFLKRKFLNERSERAKLIEAELSEDPDTTAVSGNARRSRHATATKKGFRHAW